MAAELARDPWPRLPSRHPRSDVLACTSHTKASTAPCSSRPEVLWKRNCSPIFAPAERCVIHARPPQRSPGPQDLRLESMQKVTKIIATFSIVGFDPETDSLGVAVQSKFLAVGSVVPWARAGVGAVATQAMANYNYGPHGLELMARGKTADETVEGLISADEDRQHRQVGAVDARGRAATFTGSECFEWAGGATGEHYAVQGNILVGGETVEAMARTYTETQGDLATRLLSALDAGQAAGGDSRGKQSAALLVVREGGGYGGDNDRVVDLRVDDHPDPIRELVRIRE